MEKPKAKENPQQKKRKKKNRPTEERKLTILSRKENNSFVKATGTGGVTPTLDADI